MGIKVTPLMSTIGLSTLPGAITGCPSVGPMYGDGAALSITLDLVAEGLTAPVFLTHADDGSGRTFIVDQAGQIRIVDQGGMLLDGPFLDLNSKVVELNPGFDERGMLGPWAG